LADSQGRSPWNRSGTLLRPAAGLGRPRPTSVGWERPGGTDGQHLGAAQKSRVGGRAARLGAPRGRRGGNGPTSTNAVSALDPAGGPALLGAPAPQVGDRPTPSSEEVSRGGRGPVLPSDSLRCSPERRGAELGGRLWRAVGTVPRGLAFNGIKAHGSIEQRAGGNAGPHATDSPVEQHLEVGCQPSKPRRARRRAPKGEPGRWNGEKVSAAVTRYGCWRGKCFEGCDANGDGPPVRTSSEAPRHEPETWRTPRPDAGCNKPARCRCGVSRRSREERQGRNERAVW
jgi:hypothetical protein